MQDTQIAFIGFGEAARAFLDGWTDAGIAPRAAAFDVKTEMPETRAAMLAEYQSRGARGTETPGEALTGASAVFSLVTADQSLAAAERSAPDLGQGCLWLDCNSTSPGTKRRVSEIVAAAGGRYVDVAVMAPVHPKRHRVPLLIAGPHTADAARVFEGLGMSARPVGDEIGRASSIKMLRSVMIKGMEALTAECFLAARRAGVEDEVIGSLETSDPEIAWRKRGSYCLERMMVHGTRRAAEMREVAITVRDLGLGGGLSAATAEWQDRIACLEADPGDDDLYDRLDTLLARLG